MLHRHLRMQTADGKAELHLSETAGFGRKIRKAQIPSGKLTDFRILADT